MIDHPFVRCRADEGSPCLSARAGRVSDQTRCHYWRGIGPMCNQMEAEHVKLPISYEVKVEAVEKDVAAPALTRRYFGSGCVPRKD